MIVECIGPPGGGKSFVTSGLVEELRARGIAARAPMDAVGPSIGTVRRVGTKVGRAVGECVRSPRAALHAVQAVHRSGQRHRRDELARSLNWLTLRGLVRSSRRSGDVCVFDQAALVELWSTGFAGDDAACRRLLVQPAWAWVLPDVVIRIVADPADCADRLRRRSTRQSRVESLPDDELPAAVAEISARFDELAVWWLNAPSNEIDAQRRILDLENSGDAQLGSTLCFCAESIGSIRDVGPEQGTKGGLRSSRVRMHPRDGIAVRRGEPRAAGTRGGRN